MPTIRRVASPAALPRVCRMLTPPASESPAPVPWTRQKPNFEQQKRKTLAVSFAASTPFFDTSTRSASYERNRIFPDVFA
jgi:hypothetical protein